MTQEEALRILKAGANVFLTGEPGSGKTHTINKYLEYLRSCGVEPAVTASTGIAATHVGGMTIHAWSGIGVRRTLTQFDLDKLMQNERLVRRLSEAHVLVIDEVSMLSGSVLSMIEIVCRTLRRKPGAFGGLQVILVGDFFQLPPVIKREEAMEDPHIDFDSGEEAGTSTSPFAYHSRAWKALNPLVCYLSEQHRQEDLTFTQILSAIRQGDLSPRHFSHLGARQVKDVEDIAHAGITKLFPHNVDVDRINDVALTKLSGELRVFPMQDRGAPPLIESLKRNCLSPETLRLKIGAKVMFTKNDPQQKYVNGTTGEVSSFAPSGYPLVKTRDGSVIEAEPAEWSIDVEGRSLAKLIQIPLRLAWAITVHKSQGMSLDAALIDLSQAFEYGQGYVALSRVRSLEGLYLIGWNDRALEVHPEVLEKDSELREYSAAAAEKFASLSAEELAQLHENFLRACGGKAGAGPKVREKKVPGGTYETTRELILEKRSIKEIAKKRGMTEGTIVAHIEKLIEEGKLDPARDLRHIDRPKRFDDIKKAFEKIAKKERTMPLSSARTLLKNKVSYDDLRLARLFLRA